MSKDKIQKVDKQDLSLVVRAIGTDIEHTQVRVRLLRLMLICFSTIGK